MNLPAAIEDLSGSGDAVPQSVLDKANDIKEKGGLGAIDNLMQNLPDLLTRNREVLDEVISIIWWYNGAYSGQKSVSLLPHPNSGCGFGMVMI